MDGSASTIKESVRGELTDFKYLDFTDFPKCGVVMLWCCDMMLDCVTVGVIVALHWTVSLIFTFGREGMILSMLCLVHSPFLFLTLYLSSFE